jgi:FixJ family two-component response regulator
VGRHSPFQVVLTAEERRLLEARVRRPKAEQRELLRARIVLAAAQGEENKLIAERLGIAPNTASKWRKALSHSTPLRRITLTSHLIWRVCGSR